MTQTNFEFLREAQQKINDLERKVDKLVTEYNLIIRDHHKDSDCRWAIQRIWEYGEPDGWWLRHGGYCYCEVDEQYSTYYEALKAMYEHLVDAVGQVVEFSENT
jgi:hypothetical protein